MSSEQVRQDEQGEPVCLTLPLPPSANRYWRMVNGHVTVSAEARAYKANAGWQAKLAGIDLLSGDLAVTLTVYRRAKKGDLDNYTKVTLDALNGIVWSDDSQIVELHAYRCDDKVDPRVVLQVRAAGC